MTPPDEFIPRNRRKSIGHVGQGWISRLKHLLQLQGIARGMALGVVVEIAENVFSLSFPGQKGAGPVGKRLLDHSGLCIFEVRATGHR